MMPMPIDRPLVAAGVAALIVSASTTSLVVNESATITSGKDPDWQSGIFKKVGLDVTTRRARRLRDGGGHRSGKARLLGRYVRRDRHAVLRSGTHRSGSATPGDLLKRTVGREMFSRPARPARAGLPMEPV
jgi:hypothetical protein